MTTVYSKQHPTVSNTTAHFLNNFFYLVWPSLEKKRFGQAALDSNPGSPVYKALNHLALF